MLDLDNTALVVIDVQGKLAELMHQKESLFENLARLIQGAQILEMPIILTEQYPKGLGRTIDALSSLMPAVTPVEKITFSCCANPDFSEVLRGLHRKQLLVCGIETHICVYQTTMDLLTAGYEVHIVSDAVSSRSAHNKQLGLERMKSAGAVLTGTEMALFELLHIAQGEKFKQISKLVK
ncbi:isochorismatase hydrolase [Chloroherpeton thalassium ATCC 35110]|uniref:Isochorismatase hydrolase n=1 Tax=Chloroherpeton thalassium (strain ATCC 35110 / GB-78) TaxID=517418 RepID=B3QS73_CHLT3|nr:hydrolase [Chloroherpeton thalassium]ACF14018.1 isochorismatase hydrolase [Chloroherpeton thalassium ATCC 35110]